VGALRLADIRAQLREEAQRCRDQAAVTKYAVVAHLLRVAATRYDTAAAEIVRGFHSEQQATQYAKSHHGEDI
jgi:hypothetical protein